jgi:hypothetical protein
VRSSRDLVTSEGIYVPVLQEALDAADALYRYNGGAVTH